MRNDEGTDPEGAQSPYDIYERVFRFVIRVILFVRTFPNTLV